MALKTPFVKIAQSGPTCDGREISPEWINQMAANYDPNKYGARIFLEHLRGLFPDSAFKAYGDVVALRAEDGPDGTRVLMAELEPTDSLIEMNRKRQKVYTSIEVDPDFAGTGEAYLVGLAVTDSPASLGTEVLRFSAQNKDKIKGGDALAKRIYSDAIDATDALKSPPPSDPPEVKEAKSLVARMATLLLGTSADTQIQQDASNPATQPPAQQPTGAPGTAQAPIATADHGVLRTAIVEMATRFDAAAVEGVAAKARIADLEGKIESLSEQIASLSDYAKLPSAQHRARPPVSGGPARARTDC